MQGQVVGAIATPYLNEATVVVESAYRTGILRDAERIEFDPIRATLALG